jgi:Sulfotransferase domain
MGGIIWLASYPKSGNTWTRTFIHNLFLDPDKPVDINAIGSMTIGDGSKTTYEKIGGKPFDAFTPEEVAALTPKVHRAYTNTHPDSVFVKTHSVVGSLHNVPLITMEYTVGAIYIIRNPLDVVISLSDHYGYTLDEGIEMMNRSRPVAIPSKAKIPQIYGSWSAHVGSWHQMKGVPMMTMRYEDMLKRPTKVFGTLAKFLGLNPPRKRLEKAIKFSSFKILKKQEEAKGFKEKSAKNDRFFRVGKTGQWKEVLTDDQVKRIVDCHHGLMKEFGYLPGK